ncbi:MAG: preprotein translocase subunit YajC [Gemmatimonadetes bacterium]|nr:preprotein translocase subunit YajC [Gemmatimonadota bacterium]MYI06304.1 preprotein translocase subunit YajC [Gemmatimonadota bacterium]
MATVLATAPPPAVPREGGNGLTILLFQVVMIGAIFYFLLIRPQRKERQRHQEMLSQLAKGDRVMTSGGIIGQIVHASETELTIRTAENTRLVVDRGHIARKVVDA